MVNSITPKPAPKWPPVLDTDEISSDLSSSDKMIIGLKTEFSSL